MTAATDVADLLVRRGLPFREAHGVVGGLVRHALDAGIDLSDSPTGARRLLGAARRASTTRSLPRAPGWTRSSRAGGPSADRGRRAARARRGEPRRARNDAAEPEPRSDASFFDRPSARCRRRPDRLHAAPSTASAARSSRPRPMSATIPPATPSAVRPAQRSAVRPARPRLRLPLLRDPLDVQLRHRAGGERRRGADPGARADRRARGDATATRGSNGAIATLCSGPGKLCEALAHRARRQRGRALLEAPFALLGPGAGRPGPEVDGRPADRDHEGG